MPPLSDREAVEAQIRRSPELLAMFQDTLNITMLDAGIKANVIPARSEAIIDCRLLPGTTMEEWLRQLRDVIDDDRVVVTNTLDDLEPPAGVSWDTELYQVIESVVKGAIEDAVVVPGLTVGGTDNRFLRARGIPAYGFMPCLLSPEERAGFHGNDEFLSVANLEMGTELMFEIVRSMVTQETG
jgi:acetylornithine deacetylase/succinyl-diaminopimelate desuccinylase-like protein